MPQNTRPQTLATAYRVSRLVSTLPTTSDQASGVPTSTPDNSRPSLPTKPDSGGMPARFIAGTKNSTPRIGAVLARPPSRSIEVDPPTRSISPATRNSAACTVMWCAV